MPPYATIGQVFAPYCLGGRHGHWFWLKNWVVALRNRCFEASVQKSWNEPSTQLIKATSCVGRSNATIQAEELSYLSSHQTLIADKNLRRYHARTKLVKILTVMTINSCWAVKNHSPPNFFWIHFYQNLPPLPDPDKQITDYDAELNNTSKSVI